MREDDYLQVLYSQFLYYPTYSTDIVIFIFKYLNVFFDFNNNHLKVNLQILLFLQFRLKNNNCLFYIYQWKSYI